MQAPSERETHRAGGWRWLTVGVLGAGVALLAVLLVAAALSRDGAIHLNPIAVGSEASVTVPSIVVIGYGQASAAAETALLQFLVGRAQPFGIPTGEGQPIPASEVTAVARPLIDALIARGVARDDVDLVASPALASVYYGQSALRVDVVVRQPSLDRLNELVNAAGEAAELNGILLQQVGAGYAVADCAPLEEQARVAALEDAESRAQRQAAALDVPLGKLLLVSDLAGRFASESGSDTCAPLPLTGVSFSLRPALVGLTVPPYDPSAPPTAVAFVQLSLAYALP